MRSVLKQILLYLCLFLGVATLKAQHVEYGVALDTNYMMIGDQQHLTFKAKVDPGVRIVFPRLQDTVVHGLEIISGPVRDSVKEKDGRWLLEEKYVVTAFDTGVYVVPPQPITIESQEYNNIVRTDPVGLVVNTFQVDPQKGNYDIVMPYAAPWTSGCIGTGGGRTNPCLRRRKKRFRLMSWLSVPWMKSRAISFGRPEKKRNIIPD